MSLVNARVINSDIDDEQLLRETNIAKFKYFARNCFQDFVKFEYNYIDLVKNISRHFAFGLPEEIGEFFINFSSAPHYWVSDAPVISTLEVAQDDRQDGLSTVSHNFNQIKTFYSKWLNAQSDKEKQYYALSTINLIERNANEENILKNILYANILTFDKRVYSPVKSIELLDICFVKAEQVNIDENSKRELFYLIKLLKGMVLLLMESYQESWDILSEALNYKPSGISAIFFLAVAAKKLNNRKKSVELLSYVVEYDQMRFKYAFEVNNLSLFNYFIKNCNTYEIFRHFEFAEYLFDIELLIPYQNKSVQQMFGQLFEAKSKLDHLYIQKYYQDDVKYQLAFLMKFSERYKTNKNMMLPFTEQFIKSKFNNVLNSIKDSVKQHYENLVAIELKLYDEQYYRNVEEKKLRDGEAGEVIQQYKKDMENALHQNEEGYELIIKSLEKRIERLNKTIKYDPKLAFNNSMVYATIIGMIAFILGGFIDGISDTNPDTTFEILSAIFWGGMKWGGLTFLLGLIISLLSAISAIWERNGKKAKYEKEIKLRKKHKEWMDDAIKREQNEKIKLYDTNHKKKMRNLENENEELIEDKNKKTESLSTRYVNTISEIEQALQKIYLV